MPSFSPTMRALSLPPRLALTLRRLHKWLALFVGVQLLVWSLSGLYMTAVHIDIIHGDHFIRAPERRPVDLERLVDPVSLAAAPGVESVRLHWLLGRPTYILATGEGSRLIDATNGRPLPPPDEAQIRRLADDWYSGDAPLVSASLIRDIPREIRGRAPPVWRVEFGGWNRPTLYFSPETGELLTRRHELWRVFDFLWMMHIMDYRTRDNVNNPLLRVFTWAAVVTLLSGAGLLLYSFPRRRRRKAKS